MCSCVHYADASKFYTAGHDTDSKRCVFNLQMYHQREISGAQEGFI